MSSPSTGISRSSLFLGLAFLLILGIGGGVAWLLARAGVRAPLRIVIVAPVVEGDRGLEPAECRAICSLLQDHLEHLGRFAVTNLDELPANLGPFRDQPRTLLLQVQPGRRGNDLILSYRFAWGRELAKEPTTAWVFQRAEAKSPVQAFEAFLKGFPEPLRGPATSLLPKGPAVFWDVVRAGAWRFQNQHLAQAITLASQVTRQEPECASAWILLGNLRYREILNTPLTFRQAQTETEDLLQRGLNLAPFHPRGTFLLSLLKSDSGNQREALELLLKARRRQPHNPTLLTGIAYAARGAGLLPLARRAMDIRDELAFSRLQPF